MVNKIKRNIINWSKRFFGSIEKKNTQKKRKRWLKKSDTKSIYQKLIKFIPFTSIVVNVLSAEQDETIF